MGCREGTNHGINRVGGKRYSIIGVRTTNGVMGCIWIENMKFMNNIAFDTRIINI